MEPKIIVVTTLYNASEYIERCIGSIMSQTHKNFVCYITDDISTDDSVLKAKNAILGDERFKVIENKEKLYQPGNYDQVIRNNPDVHDEDIIIEVDGDDWLPDIRVFERVYNHYKSGDYWIAYGNFKYSHGAMGFSSPPISFNTIRSERFCASHIRTWKAFLWRAIDQDYLKDDNGIYWHVAGDLAFMYPMLEMAGPDHFKFMTEVNYVYNDSNPISDSRAHMPEVTRLDNLLRNKKPYNRLIR